MDLAVEQDRRLQPPGGGGMEPGFGKRLVYVLRAVYDIVRRGLCRKRHMMDLHLLLGRGKLAGRALRDLLTAHQPHAGHLGGGGEAAASPSALWFYSHNPRDVEFSCTTTPSYAPARVFPFRIRGRGARAGKYGGLDAAAVALAFEMMNAEAVGAGGETPGVPGATPSPMLALSLGRSPAGVRQLRITDSPFPVEPEGVDERVDAEADDFIKRFYEQLQLQQSAATPDNCARRRG